MSIRFERKKKSDKRRPKSETSTRSDAFKKKTSNFRPIGSSSRESSYKDNKTKDARSNRLSSRSLKRKKDKSSFRTRLTSKSCKLRTFQKARGKHKTIYHETKFKYLQLEDKFQPVWTLEEEM